MGRTSKDFFYLEIDDVGGVQGLLCEPLAQQGHQLESEQCLPLKSTISEGTGIKVPILF